MAKISVIVPVYNVEEYIERCVCSLMEQTMEDIEYIFVDDASPDSSITILKDCIERYPQRKSQTIKDCPQPETAAWKLLVENMYSIATVMIMLNAICLIQCIKLLHMEIMILSTAIII